MVSLDNLLKQMDHYNWNNVENYNEERLKRYTQTIVPLWIQAVNKVKFKFEGLALDVACGPLSISAIYPNTIGYDIDPKMIKSVRKQGYRGIIGDIRNLPFDDKTFDVTVSFGPPLNLRNENNKLEQPEDKHAYIEQVVDEMIRVTKKRILITHSIFVKNAPKKYEHFEKFKEENSIFYCLQSSPAHNQTRIYQ